MSFFSKRFSLEALFTAIAVSAGAHFANNDFNVDKALPDESIETIDDVAQKVPDTPILPVLAGGLALLAYPYAAENGQKTKDNLKERFKKHSEEDIRHTAYHEAGHALVNVLNPSWFDIQNATILPNANSVGTVNSKAAKPNFTKQEALNRLASNLAAKIAEEEIFGEYESGSSGDISSATGLAEYMVKELGMGDGVPLKNYTILRVQETMTDADKEKLNNAVNNLIKQGEDIARKTIRENRPALDAIAARLIEIRNPYRPWGNKLKGDEIKAIIAKHTEEKISPDAAPDPASAL